MISSTCRVIFRSYHFCNFVPCFAVTKGNRLQHQRNTINVICTRFLSDDVEPIDVINAAVKKQRTKTPPPPKITLLDQNNNIISVTTVNEAEKIAEHKKLKLIRIIDNDLRTVRPVYRLMSDAQILEEELAHKEELRKEKRTTKDKEPFIKGEKVILLSVNITKNDLDIKLKKTEKWVDKRYEVRIVISGSAENTAPQEAMFKNFEKNFEGKARIVQKRVKSGDLKFQIIPLKSEGSKSKSGTQQPSSEDTEVILNSSIKPDIQESSSEYPEIISNSSKI